MQRKSTAKLKFLQTPFISFINNHSKIYDELNGPIFKAAVENKASLIDLILADQTNTFNISREQLNTLITEMTEYVFDLDKKHFVSGEDANQQILVTCLASIFHMATQKFNVNLNDFSKEAFEQRGSQHFTLVRVISFIISLRITKEIKNGATLDTHSISKEEAIKDFENLKNYDSAVINVNNLTMKKFIGKKAADYFTLEFRHKASPLPAKAKTNAFANSIFDEILGDKPHILVVDIRSEIGKLFKDNIEILKTLTNDNLQNCGFPVFTRKMIMDKIRRDRQVGMFPPYLVHDVISALEHQFEFQFPTDQNGKPNGAMVDDCLGWAPREIGAIAHPKIKIFTGIEPNPSEGLQKAYRDIPEFFAPGKMKSVKIINKKVEDVTTEELQLGTNQTYQLISTSPPYGVESYYKGETFYGNETALNTLFTGLINTTKVLDVNGVMAINFGVVGATNKPIRHLPNMFANFIQQHSELELMTDAPVLVDTRNKRGDTLGKEFFIFAKRPGHKGSIPRTIKEELMELVEEEPTTPSINLKRPATDFLADIATPSQSKRLRMEKTDIRDLPDVIMSDAEDEPQASEPQASEPKASIETILRNENQLLRNENLFFRKENNDLRQENLKLRQENSLLLEKMRIDQTSSIRKF